MITLVEADRDPAGPDSKLIWEWRNDPVTREMSRTSDPIPWERHQAWFRGTTATILIALVDEQPAGMVRFDAIEPGHAEVNINLNPAMRGAKLGEPILSAACAYGFGTLGLQRIRAEVKPQNIASTKIFTRAGFVLEGEHDGLCSYQLTRG